MRTSMIHRCRFTLTHKLNNVYVLQGLLLSLLALITTPTLANDSDYLASIDNELLLFFDETELVTVATKNTQNAREAPAVTTVITEKDIRESGAKNLIDILERVPGIQVIKTPWKQPIIMVRGLKNLDSATIKFLINGQSVNDNLSGGAMYRHDDLSVENIKRIEIMRGPGSALYGANAFSGIINITTKRGIDIEGHIVTATKGDNNTRAISYQSGHHDDHLDVSFTFDYLKTDAPRLDVEQDALGQSGHTYSPLERFDSAFQISLNDISLKAHYISNKKGPFIGIGNALNKGSSLVEKSYFINLAYDSDVFNDSRLRVSTFFSQVRGQYKWELFPAGTYDFGGGNQNYPEGVLGHPLLKEKDKGVELQFDTPWLEYHNLTTGIVYEKRQTYNAKSFANFHPITFAPLDGGIQEITSWGNYTTPSIREVTAIYAQDIWQALDGLTITSGIRHDHYSDFGMTTNPRLAFVWQLNKYWHTKLLAGSAFRVPAYSELYVRNNPVAIGNENLKPEKMRTYEIANGYSSENLNFQFTLFHNRFENRITTIFNTDLNRFQYQNSGGAKLTGLESEAEYRWSKSLSMYANATLLNTKDTETDERLHDIAHASGNISMNYHFSASTINLHLLAKGPSKRAPGDSRNDLGGYGIVNMAYTTQVLDKQVELRAAIHNVLDKKSADPVDANTIPNDLPNDDRTYMVNISYKFGAQE